MLVLPDTTPRGETDIRRTKKRRAARATISNGAPCEVLETVANELPIGMVLLNEDHTILWANSEAERLMALEIDVKRDPGGLLCTTSARSQPVSAILQPAGANTSLRLGSLFVSGLRIEDSLENDEPSRPATQMILLADPCRALVHRSDEIAGSMDLTPMEGRVAAGLASGQSPSQIASFLRIQVGTVRSHMKKVFQKANVTRQSQLVHLLLQGPLSLPRGAEPIHMPRRHDTTAARENARGDARAHPRYGSGVPSDRDAIAEDPFAWEESIPSRSVGSG